MNAYTILVVTSGNMRVRPSTLLLVGVVILVAPLASLVFARSPLVWFVLGCGFVLAGIGTALHRRDTDDVALSRDTDQYIVCPHCDTRNYASRDACRVCEREF